MQDNFDENELLDIENYSLPEKKEVVLDLGKNKVEDIKSLSPIEMIVVTAKEKGIELINLDISKGYVDTGCRKKGCYGRGYTSWDGIIPIPCSCVFKEKQSNQNFVVNRRNIRAYTKNVQKENYAFKMRIATAMNLKNVGNGFWKSKNGIVFTWARKNDKWGFQKYNKDAVKELED